MKTQTVFNKLFESNTLTVKIIPHNVFDDHIQMINFILQIHARTWSFNVWMKRASLSNTYVTETTIAASVI